MINLSIFGVFSLFPKSVSVTGDEIAKFYFLYERYKSWTTTSIIESYWGLSVTKISIDENIKIL